MSCDNDRIDHESSPHRPRTVWSDLWIALAVYWLSTNVVLVAAFSGAYFCAFGEVRQDHFQGPDLLAWDGRWYWQIASQGYSFEPGAHSSVAFFPAYPIASSLASSVLHLPVADSLLAVSHACLVAALFTFLRYLRVRLPDGPRRIWYYSLASAALFPSTFFFRMAYSESTFLLFAVLALFGIANRWKPIAVALIVGLATAARPVGVVLLLPFVAYLWQFKPEDRDARSAAHQFGFWVRFLAVLIVASWGLLLYTAFLWRDFGEPLAWVKSQQMWRSRPDPGAFEKGFALATFEPLWSCFTPGSKCYWSQPGQPEYALLSIRFWNPIYFAVGAILLGIGIRRRWLTSYEALLGVGLLLVPYLGRGYEMCMQSQGRFVAVAFPIYLVIGRLLAMLPTPVAMALLALSGFLMALHAGAFGAGYIVI